MDSQTDNDSEAKVSSKLKDEMEMGGGGEVVYTELKT